MKELDVTSEKSEQTDTEPLTIDGLLTEANTGEQSLRNQYFMQLGVKNFLTQLKANGYEIAQIPRE